MNEKIKLWLDALRSGKYNQCKKKLVTVDKDTNERSYCAMGVLCDVLKYDEFPSLTPNVFYKDEDQWLFSIAIPEHTFVKEFGEEYLWMRDAVVHMNDTLEYDFIRIADELERELYIRANPECQQPESEEGEENESEVTEENSLQTTEASYAT